MKKPIKWAIWGLVIMSIIGYSVYEAVKPLQVEAFIIASKTIEQTLEEEGMVLAVVDRPIYTQGTGQIAGVYVKEGQLVKKGDILMELDTTQLQYQIAQLRAQEKSTQGQKQKTYQEMEQQLTGLRAQLQSIEGQENQSNKAPYEAQVRQQQLAIQETEQQLAGQQKEVSRLGSLYETGAVSKKDLDDAQRKMDQITNTLQQQKQMLLLVQEQHIPTVGTTQYFAGQKNAVKAQIGLIEQQLSSKETQSGTKQYFDALTEVVEEQMKELIYQLEKAQVKAPIDGMIKNLSVKEGMFVSPQVQLMDLFQTGAYEIETYMITEDVVDVQEGMKVGLKQPRKDKDVLFEGIVERIAPAAEDRMSALGLIEQRVKVVIVPIGTVPPVRPGYKIDVQFTTLREENRVAVPKTSLFPYEDGDGIWILQEGRAKIQPVVKGMETIQEVVILEGLKLGDTVIRNPQLQGLKEGKAVVVHK